MTLAELKSLTGSQLRILVAEAEGWKPCKHPICRDFNGEPWDIEEPPHYDSSRDAITEAILRRFVTDVERARFATELIRVLTGRNVAFLLATASAEDLCRAFLLALPVTARPTA